MTNVTKQESFIMYMFWHSLLPSSMPWGSEISHGTDVATVITDTYAHYESCSVWIGFHFC